MNCLVSNSQELLQFNSSGNFKIVQLTDVHWIPNHKNTSDIRKGIISVLDTEKPDFVIFSGDYINGQPVLKGMDELFDPVVERGIPFATVFGNHDDEQGVSKQDIYNYLQTIKNECTTTAVGVSGMSNFALEIKSSTDKNKTVALIYGFDSHSYSDVQGFNSYGWVKHDQVAWYIDTAARYTRQNNNKPLPAIAFLHIPLPEYNIAARNENSFCIGVRKESACSPSINTGLFAAMLKEKDIMATFAGHDHVNDYATILNGIALVYGRFSGGNNTYCDIPEGSGARVINLKEGQHVFETWIRLYNGNKITPVTYPTDFIKAN